MYRVIDDFVDLKDSRYAYHRGDIYPRDGVSVSEDRVNELSGSDNLCRKPLIEEVVEKTTTPEVEPQIEEPKVPKSRKKRASK